MYAATSNYSRFALLPMGTSENTKHKGWTWIMAMPLAEVRRAGVDFDPNNRTVEAIQGDAASGSALEVIPNNPLFATCHKHSVVLAELIHFEYHLLGASIEHSCCLCFAGTPVELLCKGLFGITFTESINSLLPCSCLLTHLLARSLARLYAGSPTTQLII